MIKRKPQGQASAGSGRAAPVSFRYQTLSVMLIVPLLVLLMAQTVQTGGLDQAFSWLLHHPLPALLNYLLGIGLYGILLALTNRFFISYAMLMFVSYVMATVDHIKWSMALTHFVFSDLFKSSDASRFAELIVHYARLPVFLPIALLLGLGLFVFWRLKWRPRLRWPARLILLVVSLLATGSFVFYNSWGNSPVSRQILHLPAFSSQDFDGNVRTHGLLLAFFGHIPISLADQPRPADYSPESVAAADDVLQRLNAGTAQIQAAVGSPSSPADQPDRAGQQSGAGQAAINGGQAASEKPTIIVLAVEALWDITRVKGVSFAQDPFGPFRADYAGEMVSSCFGGLTANTEFEFLTGNSMHFMYDSACPYLSIDRPVPSLASYLHQAGYQATAYHSYGGAFYRRTTVVPDLGFDRFISLEDMANPRIKGWYMADEDLAPRVISQLEQNSGPQLLYVLTMQNHGPYATDRYQPQDYDPALQITYDESLGLNSADRTAVASYTQGVIDAGHMYQALKDYCATLDRPVIILTFGDHLPSIGENSGTDILIHSGLAADVMDQAMYQLPLMYWRNPAAQTSLETASQLRFKEPVTFNGLKPALLRSAGLPLSPYDQFVENVQRIFPVLTARHSSTPNPAAVQALASLQMTPEQVLAAYETLQYDQLWGQQYLPPARYAVVPD